MPQPRPWTPWGTWSSLSQVIFAPAGARRTTGAKPQSLSVTELPAASVALVLTSQPPPPARASPAPTAATASSAATPMTRTTQCRMPPIHLPDALVPELSRVSGGSATHRAVFENAQWREDGGHDDDPDERELDRVLGRETRRRKGIRVAPQLAGRGGECARRVPLGDRPQPVGQRLRRHEHVRHERDREQHRERELLRGLGRLHQEPDPHAKPGHREREQHQEAYATEEREDVGVHAPADRETGEHEHDEDPAVVH